MTATPWPILPVTGIQVYRQDVVVVRRGFARQGIYPGRADIKVFSRRSRQRLAFVASNTDIMFTSMLTLTYPREFPNEGKDVKRNLNAFFVALRRKVPAVSMLWFLEFQRRGAPHVHILLRGVRVYKPMIRWVSETWYRICDTGDPRHLRAGTRLERVRSPNGARNYTVKYAHKMIQKAVPEMYRNVGRFWGHSRDVKPVLRRAVQCTNDDLVDVLQSNGWVYLKGETIRYHTLYGVAPMLTEWLTRAILVPSTSRKRHSRMTIPQRRRDDGHQATSHTGRRIRSYHAPHLRDGGGNHPGADADRCR